MGRPAAKAVARSVPAAPASVKRRELLLGGLAVGAGWLGARARRAHGAAPATPETRRRHYSMPVIDAHAHWYPPEWVRLVQRDGPANGAKLGQNDRGWPTFSAGTIDAVFPPAHIDIPSRLQKMDAQGVDVHALSLTLPMVNWAPPALGLKLAQTFNDACAAVHQKYPKRFFGLAALPMQAPDLALSELERAARLPGMRGLYLSTHINGKNLDEKAYLPFFARCQELGWTVFLHPLDPVGAERMSSYYLRNLLGNPYDTGIAAASLVFGGVMDALPRLEVVLPHSGGTFPALIGRLDHGTEVRAELKHMKHLASAYLRRFHYDTIAHNPQLVANLIKQVGADRVVLGSDFPFDMGYEKPVELVEGLKDVSGKDRELILGRNAARLLRV
jgi:aminocarboxymuconate-semialdehyde decarboxylase